MILSTIQKVRTTIHKPKM